MQPDTLNKILEAIQSRMQAELLGAGILIALSALASYFGARLKKSGELREINEHFEEIVAQQKRLTEKTGKIKASLDQGNLRYQIKLSAYHENAVRAIEALYIECLLLRDAAISVAYSRAEREALFEQSRSLVKMFDKNRIWLPDDLSEHIRQFTNELDLRSRRFIRSQDIIDRADTAPAAAIQSTIDEQEAFHDLCR